MYHTFNQAKIFPFLFDDSTPNRSLFSKNARIYSRDGTNLFLGSTKVDVQFQAKLEPPRGASQKRMTLESLVLL